MTKKSNKIDSKWERITARIISGERTPYNADYHIPMLLMLFADGHAVSSFCVAAEISESTFYNWLFHHPEFSEAYDMAKMLAQSWLEAEGRKGMLDPLNFNATAWSMQMRNRCRYTDKRKIHIKEMKDAKSFISQYDVIKEQIAEGLLTADEAVSLTNMVATGAKITESTKLIEDVQMLKDKFLKD